MKKIIQIISLSALSLGAANAAVIANADLLAGPVTVCNTTGDEIIVTLTGSAPRIAALTVQAGAGIRDDGGTDSASTTYSITFTSTTVTDIDVNFLAGGVQQGDEFWTLSATGGTITFDSVVSPSGTYDAGTGVYDNNTSFDDMGVFAYSGGIGPIDLTTDGAGSGRSQFFGDFDVVGFSTKPIPEPSSAALLGLGGLALVMRRRRA